MSTPGGSFPFVRIATGAAVGLVAGLVVALILREAADSFSDGPGIVLIFAVIGAVIGGLAALLITAERRDDEDPSQGRKRKM